MGNTRDLAPQAWRRMATIRGRLETFLGRRGYDVVGVPSLEQTELFLRKSGGELASRMYSFTDPSGRRVSLRPEFTSSVVRAYAEGTITGPLPLRLQYHGPVFRYEGEGEGHSGAIEFEQVGAEMIGAGGEVADAEVIALAAQGLALLGVRGHRLRIGHVGVANALLGAFGLTERARVFILGSLDDLRAGGLRAESVHRRAEDMGMLSQRKRRQLTSLASRLATEDAKEMVEGFLADAVSGATGQRSAEEIFRRYLEKLREVGDPAAVKRALDFAGDLAAAAGPISPARKRLGGLVGKYRIDPAVLEPLDRLIEALNGYDLMGAQAVLDIGTARGIAYYTGVVFDIEHARVKEAPPLGGGGRYDGLVRALGADGDAPALGFAYSLERISQLLPTTFGDDEPEPPGRVLITAQETGIRQAVETAERLRAQGIPAEIEVLGRNDRESARYAKQRGIETIIRVGRDGTVDEQRV